MIHLVKTKVKIFFFFYPCRLTSWIPPTLLLHKVRTENPFYKGKLSDIWRMKPPAKVWFSFFLKRILPTWLEKIKFRERSNSEQKNNNTDLREGGENCWNFILEKKKGVGLRCSSGGVDTMGSWISVIGKMAENVGKDAGYWWFIKFPF